MYFCAKAVYDRTHNPQWNNYELLDSGSGEKLERFGEYILIRPEPEAKWEKSLAETRWQELAHVRFIETSLRSGEWQKLKEMPDKWQIAYQHNDLDLHFKLALTTFKHVGIFPEQSVNWDYIYDSLKAMPLDKPKFLNLFAYTGGASLAAKSAGADVYHVDSVKQVIGWAKENMQLSGLNDVRWVLEDAMKFVKRSVKRGTKFNGIILDPPAFGHGPKGERWKLDKNLPEILEETVKLMDPDHHLFILNVYSLGMPVKTIEDLLHEQLKKHHEVEIGNICLAPGSGKKLPLGIFTRFRKI